MKLNRTLDALVIKENPILNKATTPTNLKIFGIPINNQMRNFCISFPNLRCWLKVIHYRRCPEIHLDIKT
jgi:hypothetical protein